MGIRPRESEGRDRPPVNLVDGSAEVGRIIGMEARPKSGPEEPGEAVVSELVEDAQADV